MLRIFLITTLLMQGCASFPGAMPPAHVLSESPKTFALGGTGTTTLIHDRRGDFERVHEPVDGDTPSGEHTGCALPGHEQHDFQPAIDASCVLDGQLWLQGRTSGIFSFGGLVFAGQTSGYGIGGFSGLHILSGPEHSLALSGGLGLAWLSASLSYAYRIDPSVWLYVTPELRIAGMSSTRITTGATIHLAGIASLLIETGYAYHREQQRRVDGRDGYAYLAWHAGLGLLIAIEPRHRNAEHDQR